MHSLHGGNTGCKIISYKGCVTAIKDSVIGIFELDQKHLLYTTLGTYFLDGHSLTVGTEIFISNVHLNVIDKQKVLVCCPESSIELENKIKISDKNMELSPSDFIKKYIFHFNDVLCIELLLKELELKFSSLLKKCKLDIWKILVSILEDFLSSLGIEHNAPASKVIFEKGACNFHCNGLEKSLLKEFQILSLPLIISQAKRKIVWHTHLRGLKYCTVKYNPTNSVLVGLLYQGENSCFYVRDSEETIVCILRSSSDTHSNRNKFICDMNFRNVSYVIAVKHFAFVFEQFTVGEYNTAMSCYLKINISDIVFILKIANRNEITCAIDNLPSDINDTVVVDKLSSNKQDQVWDKEHFDISEVMSSLQEKLTLNACADVNYDRNSVKTYICQEFEVITRAWSFARNKLFYNKVLVVLLEKTFLNLSNEHLVSGYGFLNLEECEKRTCDQLIDQMSNMHIGDGKELTMFYFRNISFREYGHLIPGHKYYIMYPVDSQSCRKTYNYSKEKKIYENLTCLSFTAGVMILHSTHCQFQRECSGESPDLNLEVTSVQEIISKTKRAMPKSIVRGILVDKFLINDNGLDVKNASDCERITLSLVLADRESTETLRIYIPFWPPIMYGILPGTQIDLFGCLSAMSQKMNIYLKASEFFSFCVTNIHPPVKEETISSHFHQYLDGQRAYTMTVPGNLQYVDSPTPFECICFLKKISSAKIYPCCIGCLESRHEKCGCKLGVMATAEASFEVDIGNEIILMHTSGDNLRILLGLSMAEWHSLQQCVQESDKEITFNHNQKLDKPLASNFMKELFHEVCTRLCVNRYLDLQCSLYWTSDERNQLKLTCVCDQVTEVSPHEAAVKFYNFYT